MIVKLLTEQNLEFLSLKGGCTGLSESIHVKMLHCWKSHVTAQTFFSGSVHGVCLWLSTLWCNYCKSGIFREGFIFAKLRICEVS